METEISNFTKVYNTIHSAYSLLDDEQVINRWKYHQLHSQKRNDYDWTAFEVCEDILRQRGNSYIDERYPKD